MAKFVLRPVAQGQASIAPPPSSRLLCRRPWRGQLPPDIFRLAEGNMLMPRDLLDPGVASRCAREISFLFYDVLSGCAKGIVASTRCVRAVPQQFGRAPESDCAKIINRETTAAFDVESQIAPPPTRAVLL